MPHNVVGRRLVLGLIGNRSECVPQAIKVPVAIDAQRIQQLSRFLRYRAVGDVLCPAEAAFRDEDECSIFLSLRLWPIGNGFPQCLHSLRPKRATAWNASLRTRIVYPARL